MSCDIKRRKKLIQIYENRCQCCLNKFDDSELTIHHVIPKYQIRAYNDAKFNVEQGYILLCLNCHTDIHHYYEIFYLFVNKIHRITHNNLWAGNFTKKKSSKSQLPSVVFVRDVIMPEYVQTIKSYKGSAYKRFLMFHNILYNMCKIDIRRRRMKNIKNKHISMIVIPTIS